MFSKQRLILQNLTPISELAAKYQLPLAALEGIEPDAQHFVVRIPLIGAFSSGKSSLLNALIGNPLFAVGVTAETALPAELVYAHENSFYGHFSDGRTLALSAEDVRQNRLQDLQPEGWVEARFNAPAFAKNRGTER